MTAAELLRLAERVEKVQGPDRAVDGLIFKAVFEKPGDHWEEIGDTWHLRDDEDHCAFEPPPRYTDSLDFAMSLIGDNWWNVEAGHDRSFFAKVLPWAIDCRGGAASNAATPALALTAAALLALAAQADGVKQ